MLPCSFIRRLNIPLWVWNKAIGGKSPWKVGCIVGQLYLAWINGWKSLFHVEKLYTCQTLKTLSMPRYGHDPLLCFANAKDKAKASQSSLVDTHNL